MTDLNKEALEALVSACEADFTSPATRDEPDDEAVGGGPDGDMAITFGMIRRARAALAAAPAPAGEAEELVKRLNRNVTRLGAAISLRNWHEVEQAHAEIRDHVYEPARRAAAPAPAGDVEDLAKEAEDSARYTRPLDPRKVLLQCAGMLRSLARQRDAYWNGARKLSIENDNLRSAHMAALVAKGEAERQRDEAVTALDFYAAGFTDTGWHARETLSRIRTEDKA